MPRHNLPQRLQDTAGPAFFPSFQKEMNRLLEQFRSGFTPIDMDSDFHPLFSGTSFPAIDMIETEDTLEITAEVPGVKEEDLDVSISAETLVIKGEKTADQEQNEDSYHLIERRYGNFRRQIPLGFTPEEGAVDASFANGVLRLKIVKPVTAKGGLQKITIKKG